jgi:hypothetical protein
MCPVCIAKAVMVAGCTGGILAASISKFRKLSERVILVFIQKR